MCNFVIVVLRDKFRAEPEDVGVVKGGTAILNCSPPKGTPAPTVFWKKDGKIIDVNKDKRYLNIFKFLLEFSLLKLLLAV